MFLAPMAGTLVWTSVPLGMPVPLQRLNWTCVGQLLFLLIPAVSHMPSAGTIAAWIEGCARPWTAREPLHACYKHFSNIRGNWLIVFCFLGCAAVMCGCTNKAVVYSESYPPVWMTEMKYLLLSTSFKPAGAGSAHPPQAPGYPCVLLANGDFFTK